MAKRISTSNTRPRGPSLLSRAAPLAVRNQNQTASLLTELRGAINRSRFASQPAQQQLTQQFAHAALGVTPLPTAVRLGFATCASALVRAALPPLYSLPADTAGTDAVANHHIRENVRNQLTFLADESHHIDSWQNHIKTVLRQIATAMPVHRPTPGTLSISVPLISTLKDPVGVIDQLVRTLMENAVDPSDPTPQPGQSLSRAIVTNLLTASKLTFDDAQKRPHRLTWPAEAKNSPAELIETYLAGTAFEPLLNTPVELHIPTTVRTEHALYIAPTGHGKTQLLQALFLRDLEDPDQPTIIIIDSQLDLIATASRLKQFDPALRRRIIILDPTDVVALALNIFGWDRRYAATLPPRQRTAYLASITQTFRFVCAGLFKNELTSHMSTVVAYLVPWLLQIEGATIHTMLGILRDPEQYWHHVAALPETARTFLEELYAERSPYRDSRQRIMQRLYTVISNPRFERMFSATETFNMRRALNDGSVILISTDKPGLGEEYSAILGRFFVGQVVQATMARAFIPLAERRPAYVYIDECHDVLDASIETLLSQARKYCVSLNLFTQQLSRLRDAGMLDAALSAPAIKYVGAVSDADATLLAREMRTTPDFIKSIGKIPHVSADWAVYVRNVTPSATKITVPFGQAERAPKMAPLAYQRLLMENRRAVGAAPQTATTPAEPATNPFNNDGDDY